MLCLDLVLSWVACMPVLACFIFELVVAVLLLH